MNDNIYKRNTELNMAEKDYQDNFMPKVHRIGRITMAISFILAILPIVYFFFVKGYSLSISSYVNVATAIGTVMFGGWISEPLAYWPALGSAGTYMSYLAGGVSTIRFPVALSVQTSMKADINTPRGQVITIAGIASSVFVNLIILLIIILSGEWILSIMPKAVTAAFTYIVPCLMGSMIIMMSGSGKNGLIKGVTSCLPYLLTAVGSKLIIVNFVPSLYSFGTAISVILTVMLAYLLYRIRLSKAVNS